MSSISSISNTPNPYTNNLNTVAQTLKDFQSIGTALQSGNLPGAQSALAAFQQNLPANTQSSTGQASQTNQPFGNNTQANTAYQALSSALQSGDLSGAQKAFSDLKTDFKTARGGHHHHGAKGAASSTTADATTTTDSTTNSNSTTDGTGDSSSTSNSSGDGSLLNVVA